MEIVITSNNNKFNILRDLRKNKQFNKYKFYTMNEFKKNIMFDYNDNALEYIMDKYKVSLNIAKIYIENMYFLEDINDEKVIFLNKLKNELIDNKLLIINKLFKEYIKDKNITIYNYELTLEDKKVLKNLNINIKSNYDNYNPVIYEAKDTDTEVEFVVRSILDLINEGINIDNIKLIINSEYKNIVKFYFDMFNIPINIENSSSMYSLNISKEFLELYDDFEISDIINKLSNKYSNINDLINVLNNSCLVSNKKLRKEFIINDLKNKLIVSGVYDHAVSIGNISDAYTCDDYVFLLGFNQNSYPRVYRDEEYLSDSVRKTLGISTSLDKQRYEKNVILKGIKNIKNLVISYPLFNGKTLYPSSLIDELNVEVKRVEIDESISYSRNFTNLLYAKDLDNLYKYNMEGKYLAIYQNNLNIKYREYNNKFSFIDKLNLREKLEDGIVLSYTTLENYSLCSFKYYLGSILNLNIYEESFKTIIGNITHYILQNGLVSDIDVGLYIADYVKSSDFVFGPRELFYLKMLKEELEFVLKYLKEMSKSSSLNNYEFEVDLENKKNILGIDVTFKGFIDKLMYGYKNGKLVVAVVDYKTGEKSVKLDLLKYGINLQLPIYLYLLKKSDKYKEALIAGFYIERVLNNVFNKDPKKSIDELKKESIRLSGFTNSDIELIEMLDHNYKDGKMIKNLRFKADGSFYASSNVLSQYEMDDLEEKIDGLIDLTVENIINGNFSINPKIYKNKNISCQYCSFKDICFKSKDDEEVLEVTDEVDDGTTISN